MKKIMFILILLVVLISVSAVSAVDSDDNSISVSVSDDDAILSDNYANDDLKLDIQEDEDIYSDEDDRRKLDFEFVYPLYISEGDHMSLQVGIVQEIGGVPINLTISGVGQYIIPTGDNGIAYYNTLTDFKAGEYDLTMFVDTDKYYTDIYTDTLTVAPRVDTIMTLSIDPVIGASYGDTVTFTATLYDNSGALVTGENIDLYIDNNKKSSAKTNGNGFVTFTLDNLPAGNHTVYGKFTPGDITEYNPCTSPELSYEISKKYTYIRHTRDLINMTSEHLEDICCYLEPSEAGSISYYVVNSSVVQVFGWQQNELEAVSPGETDLIASFAGNDNYLPAENITIHVIVNAYDVDIRVNNDTVDLNEGDSFQLDAYADFGLGIGYHSNDESIATVDGNGNITAVGEGTTTITLTAGGYGFYKKGYRNVTVTVTKVVATEIAVDNTTVLLAVGEEIPSVAHLILHEKSNLLSAALNPFDLTYTVSNTSVVKVEDNLFKGVGEGNALITVSFNGFGKYAPALNKTIDVIVHKIPTEIIVLKESFNLNVGEKILDGAVLLPIGAGHMNSVSSNDNVAIAENGTIIALGAGKTVITFSFNGTDKFEAAEDKNITVTVKDTTIIARNLTKYYGGSEKFVVILTDNGGIPIANASVNITLNGVNYMKVTDENGTVSMAINLNSGEYPVVVSHNNNSVDSKITVLTTVNGTDVVKTYRNDTQYYATFLDSEGNYLKNGTAVQFNINGVLYDRKVSGDKGLAKLNINLEQGEYIITAINSVTGENTANNVTILPRIIENKDLTKYYRNASQYTVKLVGDDGKVVGKGEVVTFNINGVFYNRTSDDQGIAQLNINLQPGNYIITAEYKGCRISNNITVLPVLSANNMTKKYGTPDQFVASLVDGQGKAYVDQNVTFNINGVFYYKTTDANGQAKLNINLQAGEYIITSSYNGTNIANKVTVTA